MTSLIPGVVALGVYGAVWLGMRRVRSARARHEDRLTILEEFEREITRQK